MLALLVLVLVLIGIYLIFRKPPAKSGVIPVSTSEQQSKSPPHGAAPSETSDVSSKGGSATSSPPAPGGTPASVTLQAPSGTFVSDHHPSLTNANGASSSEVSVCTTTAGATCYLKFTKDGVIKTLPVQTTDGSGSTSWRWDVQTAGFTAGTWQITAVAILGNQTKMTTDGFPFEVQP